MMIPLTAVVLGADGETRGFSSIYVAATDLVFIEEALDAKHPDVNAQITIRGVGQVQVKETADEIANEVDMEMG